MPLSPPSSDAVELDDTLHEWRELLDQFVAGSPARSAEEIARIALRFFLCMAWNPVASAECGVRSAECGVRSAEFPAIPHSEHTPPAAREIVEFACRGNEPAAEFCNTLIDFCHLVDDLRDGDKQWTADEVEAVAQQARRCFSEGEFFQRFKFVLTPLIVQAVRAWADADAFAAMPDVRDRRAADVLKSSYHEVIFHTAYLCAGGCAAGWQHLSDVTKRCRSFNYDEPLP